MSKTYQVETRSKETGQILSITRAPLSLGAAKRLTSTTPAAAPYFEVVSPR